MSPISSVIKYEGDNSTFIWKHPCEDFNTTSQLIVHETQEAVFFVNGQALDSFGPGRHTLETENIPLLSKFLNLIVTGGECPFHCEIYYINKTVQMAVKWGTDSKVRFIDPIYGVPLEIGACGEMNLMVSDSRKLLLKLVGTMNGIAWDAQGNDFTKSLAASFRPLISSTVKTNLARCIKEQNIDILEIDEHLDLLSDVLKQPILTGFEEYGLTIPEFYVTNNCASHQFETARYKKEQHEFEEAAKLFATLPGYKDADELVHKCHKEGVCAAAMSKMNGFSIETYDEAIKLLEDVRGYYDEWCNADDLLETCHNKKAEILHSQEEERLELQRREQQRKAEAEIAARKRKKLVLIIAAAVVLFASAGSVITFIIIPNNKYKNAVALMDSGNYPQALAVLKDLGEYKDSDNLIQTCRSVITDMAREGKSKSSISIYIGSYWNNLNTELEAIPINESELP